MLNLQYSVFLFDGACIIVVGPLGFEPSPKWRGLPHNFLFLFLGFSLLVNADRS